MWPAFSANQISDIQNRFCKKDLTCQENIKTELDLINKNARDFFGKGKITYKITERSIKDGCFYFN